jgi:hypothetical protein
MNLNRALYLEIDDDTPKCVVLDLLSTCKKRVGDEYLKTKKKDIISFLKDFERSTSRGNPEMRAMATYVSPKAQSWTPRGLWKAFLHLEDFNEDPSVRNLRIFPIGTVGEKNENNPLNFDSIMIYHILQEHNLPYTYDSSLEDMVKTIEDKYNESNRSSPPPIMISPETQEELDNKNKKIKKLKNELIEEVNEKDKLRNELIEKEDNFRNEVDKLRDELEKTIHELEILKSELEKSTHELQKLNQELKRTNDCDEKISKDEYLSEIPEDFDLEKSLENLINSLRYQPEEVIMKMEKIMVKKPKFNFANVDEKEYSDIVKNIGTYSTINKSCLTDAEAVMYALRFFSIDISESQNPVTEIKHYCQCKLDKKKYKPVDPEFRKNYLQNRTWFNTDKTWKDKFSKFYKPESMSKIISYYGGTEDDTEDFFNSRDETFYSGIPPDQEGSNLSFLKKEELDEDVISYGKDGNYIYFSPQELKEYFETQKDFNHFKDQNTQLPLHTIRKLNNICKETKDNQNFSELGKRVKFFLETGKPSFPLLKELFSNYLTCQSEFENLFKNLYKLGISANLEEFEARINKNNICLEKLPKKMIDLVNKLPNIDQLEEGGRLFRNDKLMMNGVKSSDFKNRKFVADTAKFYYELISSSKID